MSANQPLLERAQRRTYDRLLTLVRRITEWENLDRDNFWTIAELQAAYRREEELILDIKQCLESVLENPEWL